MRFWFFVQARFAADCMQKSKAVYAVWVAYMNGNGTVQTDMWCVCVFDTTLLPSLLRPFI